MRTDSKSWRELARIMRQVRSLCARSLAGNPLARAKAKVLLGFDREFYLNQYPDVAAAGADPLQHYLNLGRSEGRAPSRMARFAREKKPMSVGSDPLRLSDLCDPHNEEPGPKFSDETFLVTVLTPSFNTDPRYIRELYQTLVNQSYSNWEWVVVDDGSSRTASIAILRGMARRDPRVRFFASPVNLGISGASNVGLAAAQGTHVALVDHDDLVSRHAFYAVYEAWKQNPDTHLFYTDECKLQSDGRLSEMWPKPDWSPAYLENTMCIGHLSIYELSFIRKLGGFRSEYDGTQDYDLALRAALTRPNVVHLPVFAYLWRVIEGSAALDLSEKSYAVERQGKAVLDYARHKHHEANVIPGWGAGYWRIAYPIPSPAPLLSFIIPTGGGSKVVRGKTIDLVLNCLDSFEAKAFYPNREYIIVHNGDLSPTQIDALGANPRVKLILYSASSSFNLSEKLNQGVAAARGDYICLLNDDVEAITPHGGDGLIGYLAANPRVGAIGPMCLREDKTIQQNGVVLLVNGPVHAGDGQPPTFGGHQAMLRCRREAFCIGGAVLFIKKELYETIGGFDMNLPLNYNDVDFCLRLRERGYSCVVDPYIEVYHFEGATKIGTNTVEREYLFLKHPGMNDPYFNRSFDQSNPHYRLNLRQQDARIGFDQWLDHQIARRARQFLPEGRPKLSVCVPIYNQPKGFLEEMYKSVLMQTYHNKELIILADGSSNPETIEWLERTQREQQAIVILNSENLGISGANLKLLERATGDFFVPVDADDFLAVDALQMLAYEIERHPDSKVFYSDEYKSDVNSIRFQPFFKPDFDPILVMNCCYPAHLMAIETEFLRRIGSFTDARATWCHDYDTLTRALALGEAPIHVRELLYAWRINPGSAASAETSSKPGTVDSQRFVLNRLLNVRGLEGVVSVEINEVATSTRMWRLKAAKPVPNARIFDALEVWGDEGFGVPGLVAAARDGGSEWVAILLDAADEQTLLELSAIALFEPRINAVCGVLIQDNRMVNWSGGFFLPHGRVFDPYSGQPFSGGGYHAELWCQRCIDVAAPVNVLIRVAALRRVAALSGVAGADALMVMLGVDAHQRGDLIAVTPHVQAPPPPKSMVLPPRDPAGLLLGASELERGSRWYDGRLDVERPYKMPEMA
jgi:glycosyltransferase involved in cell wall biosynthesis